MAVQWEKVYVFISSTFNDMHAERDYLVKQVFPQLQEWCEKRKLRLVDIDLRWGVTEADATQNKRVVQVCLERIDACRPFFLCFLGQRRGWVPGKADISGETYTDYPELAKYAGETSVTEMEILHALVDPLHQGKAHPTTQPAERFERVKYAFFYLRQPDYLQSLPADLPQLRQVYTNEGLADPGERKKVDQELQRWREVEIPRTQRPVHPYQADWAPAENSPEIRLPLQVPSTAQPGTPGWQAAYATWTRQWAQAGVQVDETGEIDEPLEREKAGQYNARLSQGRLGNFVCADTTLAQAVIDDLKSAIQERYPEHVEGANLSPLQRELDQQEQFLQTASEGFIERQGDFAALDEYVKNDSQQLFVLTAPGGMGKTSLLARCIDRWNVDSPAGESLHYRFIGASDGSTTVDGLLRSVLGELQEISKKLDTEIPADPNKLRMEFPGLLEAAGTKGKTIIILDGLNQLESKLSDLAWLPLALPANLKVVVSFKRGETQADNYFEMLKARGNVILAEVRPFESLADRRQLVQVYLSQFLKELDERHVETLIRSEGAANPLYLKVVLSELRVFGAFANLGEKIRADFGSDPVSAFQEVLKRLENDPAYSPVQSQVLVPRLFGWLAHARQGLSVEELSGLLLQEGLLPDDANGRCKASEAVYGLLRQVRAYLARRDGQVDFFYESFKQAVVNRYVRGTDQAEAHSQARQAEEWHAALAGYFEPQPGFNRRRLYELPYQQTYAARWTPLAHTLTDFDFLEAKCAAFSVYDLEDDYLIALRNWRGEPSLKNILTAFEERLRLDADHIHRAPELLFSQLYNHLSWLDAPDGPVYHICKEAGSRRKGWLRSLQDPRPQPPAWLHSLQGHTGAIHAAAVTPDGQQVISGSFDNTVKIWDLESGKLIRSLEGHSGCVNALAVTPDGTQVISGSADTTLKVWDLKTGRLHRSLEVHTSPINALVITSDGHRIISGAGDGLNVWDLESGRLLRSLSNKGVKAVAASGDGQRVVSGDGSGFQVWDLESGQLLRSTYRTAAYNTGVTSVAITPDGNQVVTGEKDNNIRIWDLESGQLLDTLDTRRSRINHPHDLSAIAITPDGSQVVFGVGTGITVWQLNNGRLLLGMDSPEVYALAVTPDGCKFISGTYDGTIWVWDLKSRQLLRSLGGHTREVTALALTQDGRKVVSGSWDKTVRVWDIENEYLLHSLVGHAREVSSVAVTPDGQKVVSGSWDRTLKVWGIEGGCLLSLEGHTDAVKSVAITPDGRLIVSGSRDKTLKVWDLKSGQVLRTLEGHTADINSVAVTPDGRTAVSGSSDNTLKVWDLKSGRMLHSLEGHTQEVTTVAVAPDGGQVISGSRDNTIKLWDLKRGKLLRSLKGLSLGINTVAITPDGRRVVSGTDEKNVNVWDLASGNLLHRLEGHNASVTAVTITPDGQQLVSASVDFTIKVWNLDKGCYRRSLEGHTKEVNTILITPDGRRVISGSSDQTLMVWDLETGNQVWSLLGHTNKVTAVAVTPDGHQVISAAWDHSINVWNMERVSGQHSMEGNTTGTNAIAITPDGQQVITGSGDKTIKVWDLKKRQLVYSLEGHTSDVQALVIRPNTQQVISGSYDGTIKIWDLEKRCLIRSLSPCSVATLAVTPDGRQVIFSQSGLFAKSSETTFKVADLTSESWYLSMRSMEGHIDSVRTLVVTPDGRQVVSGSDDKTIRLWNLNDKPSSRVLFWNDASIRCLALSWDGRYLCCGDTSGRVWIFERVGIEPFSSNQPALKPGIKSLEPAKLIYEEAQLGPNESIFQSDNQETPILRLKRPALFRFLRKKDPLVFICPDCHKVISLATPILSVEVFCPKCGKQVTLTSRIIEVDFQTLMKQISEKDFQVK